MAEGVVLTETEQEEEKKPERAKIEFVANPRCRYCYGSGMMNFIPDPSKKDANGEMIRTKVQCRCLKIKK